MSETAWFWYGVVGFVLGALSVLMLVADGGPPAWRRYSRDQRSSLAAAISEKNVAKVRAMLIAGLVPKRAVREVEVWLAQKEEP